MPTLISRRELDTIEVNGVPITVAFAREGKTVLIVAQFDDDGLMETRDDTRKRAAEIRDKLAADSRAAAKARRTKPWKPREIGD